LNARGYDVLQDLETFGVLVTQLRPGPAAAAAVAAGGGVSAAAQAAALQSAPGIQAAGTDATVRLIRPVSPIVPISDAQGSAHSRQQPSAAAAAAATAAQCKWPDTVNADYAVGIKKEGRSYGMKMMQADAPDIQDIADKFKSKVLYCVMDTGIDIRNQEFTGVGKCQRHAGSNNLALC
jgi:hypothetical protein